MTMSLEELERRSGHAIPHFELGDDSLPRPNAPWSELVHFAGTFDGYVVKPTPALLTAFGDDYLHTFETTRGLPEGLTLLRTALFGEQRRHHFGDWGEDPEPRRMTFMHACVERAREIVDAGKGLSPETSTPGGVSDKVSNAFERLLRGYSRWGGHGFHGWTDFPDARNFLGPTVWSERDCGLRFALELEREWPESVHMEFAIGKASRTDFDKGAEKAQRVDLAVSDLSAFEEDETSAPP